MRFASAKFPPKTKQTKTNTRTACTAVTHTHTHTGVPVCVAQRRCRIARRPRQKDARAAAAERKCAVSPFCAVPRLAACVPCALWALPCYSCPSSFFLSIFFLFLLLLPFVWRSSSGNAISKHRLSRTKDNKPHWPKQQTKNCLSQSKLRCTRCTPYLPRETGSCSTGRVSTGKEVK